MAVATAMAVIAGVSAASSAYAGHRAGGRADRAADRQAEAMANQQQIERERLDFFKGQYQDWYDMFNPVLMQLRNEAFRTTEPDYESIAADVSATFDTAREGERRTMQRYGLSPADGQFGASERQYGISKATAHVGARNQARIANKDQKFDRLSSVYGLGTGQMSMAMQGVNSGYGGMSAGAGNRASVYGNQASNYGQMATDSWTAFGSTDWDSILANFTSSGPSGASGTA